MPTIYNPVANSPFLESARYFEMTAGGEVAGNAVERHCRSEFFVPVAQPKQKAAHIGQCVPDAEWLVVNSPAPPTVHGG